MFFFLSNTVIYNASFLISYIHFLPHYQNQLGVGLDSHTHPFNSLTPQKRHRSDKVGDTIIWPRPAGTLARLYIKWSLPLGTDPVTILVARLLYPYPTPKSVNAHTRAYKSTACSRLFWKSHFFSKSTRFQCFSFLISYNANFLFSY